MTFAEAEITFINQLKAVFDAEEAKGMAFQVIHHLTGASKAHFLLNKTEILPEIKEQDFNRILEELKSGKPLQYIFNETEFYGLRLNVNPSVLIPRPETEELVDWIIKDTGTQEVSILDIGTGSGCIALALKKHLQNAEVCGMDISSEALVTARKNATLNNLNVEFIRHDILGAGLPERKYSIIVSNPPYITIEEKQHMHKNVLEHEPHNALFVPDNSPLLFYDAIATFAKNHLTENGMLFFEINENFGSEVAGLLKNNFRSVELRKDLQGKDRMVKAMFILPAY